MSSFQGQQIRISGRPTWAEIHLDNLAANFEQIRNRVSPAARIMAIVKADAYGHGALECSRRLAKSGADWFGVAIPEEGIPLRAAGNHPTDTLPRRFSGRIRQPRVFSID